MADETSTIIVNTGDGERRVDLWSYLDAEAIERAERDANTWIKSLRHVPVDGAPLRDRFLHRGDSLWWFAELYLHKRRVVVAILRTLYALESLAARERPLTMGLAEGTAMTRYLARQFAARRQIAWRGSSRSSVPWRWRVEPRWRGMMYWASASLARVKPAKHAGPADRSCGRRGVRPFRILGLGNRRRVLHWPDPAGGVGQGRQAKPRPDRPRRANELQVAELEAALAGVARLGWCAAPLQPGAQLRVGWGAGAIGRRVAADETHTDARCTGARLSAPPASFTAATRGR